MKATGTAGKLALLALAAVVVLAVARPADAGDWRGRAFFSATVVAPGFALSVGNAEPYPYCARPYAPYAAYAPLYVPAPVSYVRVFVAAPYPHVIWRPVYGRALPGRGWHRGWYRHGW